MGGSDRAEAGRSESGQRPGAAREFRLPVPRLLKQTLSLVACLLLAALSLACTGASAAQAGHSLSETLKAEGQCAFSEGGALALSESGKELYVYDRALNTVDRLSSSGSCLGSFRVGKAEKGTSASEGIAVDNSSGPSRGDVYVVGETGHTVFKFSATGTLLATVTHEFAAIHGIAVDANGDLWVYEGKTAEETTIQHFGGGEPNEYLGEVAAPLKCPARLGLAVVADGGSFYVGREREAANGNCETSTTVMVKLNSAGETATETTTESLRPGEPAYFAQLDNEPTSGVAVDAASGEAFFDNLTSVAAFDASGQFLQRFGAPTLSAGAGEASSAASGVVYVADTASSSIDVFAPSSTSEASAQTAAALPDGRAWEQVSPHNKLGASIYSIALGFGFIQASEDGNAITYVSNVPLVSAPPNNRAPEPTQNISRRGAGAWSTEDIAIPGGKTPAGYASGSGDAYEFFSADLSTAFADPSAHEQTLSNEPLLSPEATESTPYQRTLTRPSAECEPLPSTCYQALVSLFNDPGGAPFGGKLSFTSATPDGRHAVLLSRVPLTQEGAAQRAEEGLYEWEASGSLKLVSVLPSSEAAETAALTELRLGGPGEGSGAVMRDAIASDGSRVVWSTKRGEGRLYLRDMAKGETIRLDMVEGATKQPKEAHAVFQAASADDSRIFFTDTARLTADATSARGVEGPEETARRGSGDLYVCDVTEEVGTGRLGCNLKDLTAEVLAKSSTGAPAEEADVQGVLGASETGTSVYYVADGDLASQAARGACHQREGAEVTEEREGKLPVTQCSLYVSQLKGETWQAPKFVATLSSLDQNDWFYTSSAGAFAHLTSRVSPNGEYVAFMSNRELTGYDNVDVNSGARDEEVYLYGAAAEHVQCASCNPSGAQPEGVYDTETSGEGLGLIVDRPQSWTGMWLAGNIPGWTSRSKAAATYQSRYLSNSGRLFFDSADALVEADENKKEDVYEFEPQGEGTCASATGCVSLLSSGTSPQESAFLDASVSGNDVFFLTSAALVQQDTDTGFDIYDARVCTAASPCLTAPPAAPAPCKGEECKPLATSAPALPPVPSSALPSSGNPAQSEVLGTKSKQAPKKVVKKPLTRAQKLKKALKACKKLKRKSKRQLCEHQAHAKYGPIRKAKR